ncbi:MAG: glycoside hydrolase family 9 protein, partial [Ruminococcus sp.]
MVMGCTTLGQGFSAAAADATTSEEEVEINFAKALQMSLYFYDANKCGSGITGGNLEWRGDCHTEDAAVPLKPMGEDYKGTNLSQEFIDAHRDILDPDGDGTIDVAGGMHDAGDHV